MPFDDFKKKLEDRDSAEHAALLAHVRSKVDSSRNEMAKHYGVWDYHDAVFRSERALDKEDRNAVAKGDPAKINVPFTFSQIMTFVAFAVMTLTQNKRFFELEPTGSEDNPLSEPLELILERDLRKNQWTTFLVQVFLDIGRFSLGVAEVCYKEEYRHIRIQKTETVDAGFGTETTRNTNGFEKIPTFIGNKVYPISPYRFLPDTSLPLTRYQEGEYCGSEDIFQLSALQNDPSCFNLDKIPKMSEADYDKRRENSRIPPFSQFQSRSNPKMGSDATQKDGDYVTSGPVMVTKMVIDMTPKRFKVEDKDGVLGEEEFVVRYIVWLANDKVVIRFDEAYYLHGMFPYVLGQFLPDQHKTVNEGLAGVCDQITNQITWLMNAHIVSQRQALQSKFIVDPAGIDVKNLDSNNPFIFLKKNASQTGVDRYIKQFVTTDVTQNVMQDVGALDTILEKITGFAAMMQGQHSTGRRSATQDRVVAQGGSARGKTTVGGVWDTFFEPLGHQLIANNRQEMERETFDRILGAKATDELWMLFKADSISIATAEDFFVFDATLPSEKAFLAQSLQEILMTLMSNPEVAAVLGYDATIFQKLFEQVYLLRGVTPARLPSPQPQQMAPGVIPMQPAAPPALSNG